MKKKQTRYPKGMSILLNALIKEIADLTDKDADQLSKSMYATLAGTPKPNPPMPKTAYEHFVVDIFDAYSEFCQAYQSVASVTNIARLRFRQPSVVTRLEFLTFVVEASLNEFYIMSLRLNAFLTVIQKKYRADRQFATLQVFVPKMAGIIQNTLQPIVEIRGSHVHQRRFSSGDEKIKRAGTLELLVVTGKMKQLRPIYRAAMRDAEKHAIGTTRNLARNAKAISTATMKHLCEDLVDDKGRLRYPKNIKRPSALVKNP